MLEPGGTVSAIRSQRVVWGGEVRPALLTIRDGKILDVLPDPGTAAYGYEEVL